MNLDPQLAGEVVGRPDIVVAHEQVERSTGLSEAMNRGEYLDRDLGHPVVILEPEVEQVSQEIDFSVDLRGVFEEGPESFFLSGLLSGRVSAEMRVGEKQDRVVLGHSVEYMRRWREHECEIPAAAGIPS